MDQAIPPVYEIRVQGVLGETLLSAFPALSGKSYDGDTVLAGCLDQAALHGVLHDIETLGLKLLAVSRVGLRLTVTMTAASALLDR